MLQAISAGTAALAQLYGFDSPAAFMLSHIETLKQADNVLASRCGHVLEAVHVGFGMGSETSLVVIGLGRALLGGSVVAVPTAASLTNPVTLTCAAIGAIHYGWNALSEKEKTAVLDTVGQAFSVGVEFVRSLAAFALRTIRELLSKENFDELKKIVEDVAATFGRRLSEITHALSDRSRELYGSVAAGASAAVGLVPSVRLPARLAVWRGSKSDA